MKKIIVLLLVIGLMIKKIIDCDDMCNEEVLKNDRTRVNGEV